MDKKASEILFSNIVYLLLLVVFTLGVFAFISSQMNGAEIWGKYYSKEISKVINLAKPGDEITLDVQKAVEIADENEVSLNEIFTFDNSENKVCVKLSLGRRVCYNYFNDVDVSVNNEKTISNGVNVLSFKIVEKNAGGV